MRIRPDRGEHFPCLLQGVLVPARGAGRVCGLCGTEQEGMTLPATQRKAQIVEGDFFQ